MTDEQWDQLCEHLEGKYLERIVDSADERSASSTVSVLYPTVLESIYQYLELKGIPITSRAIIGRFAREWIRNAYTKAKGS